METTDYRPLYIKCGIWEQWHDKEWQDYQGDTYRGIIEKLATEQSTENVYLYGENGTGKTMLMNIAMKQLLKADKTAYVIDFRNLVREYTKSWRDEGKLAALMMKDYLAIDDLGKEFSSGDVSKDLATTTLDYVLRYRIQRMKPTWLTFNLSLGEVEPSYGKHIASLLKRNAIAVEFTGNDFGDTLFKKIGGGKKNGTTHISERGKSKGPFS